MKKILSTLVAVSFLAVSLPTFAAAPAGTDAAAKPATKSSAKSTKKTKSTKSTKAPKSAATK